VAPFLSGHGVCMYHAHQFIFSFSFEVFGLFRVAD